MTSTTTVPTDRAAILRQLISASVTGTAGTIGDLVTDEVIGWSPTLFVSSRQELLDAFEDRVDAFTNIDIEVPGIDVVRDRAIAEWHVSADFTGELEFAGSTVPPTGRRVHLAGATFADFEGGRVRAFRHYFDDAALIEQLLDLT